MRCRLSHDLAKLYGVASKVLLQAVKRNQRRFPEDFMFQLTQAELEEWRSQIVTSNPAARAQSRTLAALRDVLLPRLLSGALRVKDAEKIAGEAT